MSTRPNERAAEPADADPEPDDPSEAAEPSAGPTLADLVAKEDTDGLLALAKAYRGGTSGRPKDLAKCLECYQAAATLGSAEAEYSAALFYLSGGVVAQDLKQGAGRLRAAADAGYLPAKVYLANLYELGVHYAADPSKADVWYRSAARGAGIEGDPESPSYGRAMAELGCARYAVALAEAEGTSPEDRERFLKKAKAYGYQLKLRAERLSVTPQVPAATESTERPVKESPTPRASPSATKSEADSARGLAPKPRPKTAEVRVGTKGAVGHALWAFFFESLFVGGAVAAATLARLGIMELLARGTEVPWVGSHLEVVFPVVLCVVGVLPAFLLYKAGTVVRAVGLGAVVGGVGYALWESGRAVLLAGPRMQALALGAAGFLATLLVLGLLGGVKPPRKPARRIVS